METESLNVDEIQQRMRELDDHKAELEGALRQRQQQERLDLVHRIKELIQERDFDVADIASMLGPRRRRSKNGGAKAESSRQYTRYVDPENPNNVYTRGVVPGWMKQQMLEKGYDPNSKESRDAFKKNHLRIDEA